MMNGSMLRVLIFCGFAASVCFVTPAFGQPSASRRTPRVIEIDTLKVEGRIQKPEAFFFLQRSQLNFEGLEPKKSFLPLIIKSVDKQPF
jgi:hypothetical protein